MRRLFVVAALAVLTAACGGGGGKGNATLWVTRDRGAAAIVSKSVPAGLTAMQALRREADVKTRYGGRFVEAIDGLAGSLSRHRDWFYFVNGIEADRGAAEYRLHRGDIVWWDYRSWRGSHIRQPVAVGAFPEPFLHGYAGKVRRAAVRYENTKTRGAALGLASAVQAGSVEPVGVPVSPAANLIVVLSYPVEFSASLREDGGGAGSPVVFRISLDDAKRLLRDPELARYRYEGLP